MTQEEKLQKLLDEQMKDPQIKAGLDAIRDIFIHMIYVEPKLYEVLVSLNIALNEKEVEKVKGKKKEVFTVFTKLDHTTQSGLLSIEVNKKTALAIKEITKEKPQRLFCEVEGAPFNVEYSTLTLNNMTINISRGSLRFELCEILLADEEDIGRVWLLDEVLEIMQVEIEGDQPKYRYFRNIVKPLNIRINKQLGIPRFLDLSYKTITINPIYIYTLLRK